MLCRREPAPLPLHSKPKKPSVLVIGAGLSGLTAAALLARRGLSVSVVEQQDRPGGAASAFRRGEITYDAGAAMMFGFGQRGFNPHNWLMAELNQPIEMYRHSSMYRLFYGEEPVTFLSDMSAFISQLGRLFPNAGQEIEAFYAYIGQLYEKTIAPVTVFEAPGDMSLAEMRKNASTDILSQLKMVKMLFTSAESMMKPYIADPKVRRFFDKLTSTYCYTTVKETPAVLAATMFVDNHVGGAYYPAGSAMALAARLEKAVEENGGRFLYRTKAVKVLGDRERICGILTDTGEELKADAVLFCGSLRSFAKTMDPDQLLPRRWKKRVLDYEMTMPSFVVYGCVDRSILPPDCLPVQMFVDNREALDEADVTLYLPSLEDPSLAPEGQSTFIIIGPSLRSWPEPDSPEYGKEAYRQAKKEEAQRMLALVERRIPGFTAAIRDSFEASPSTIWRYLGKDGGSIAGPKQKMGQHLLFRQHSKGPREGLFFAGESTVMGTGTPAVTVSGISAANRILRSFKQQAYTSSKTPVGSAVTIIAAGTRGNLPKGEQAVEASRCRWCEKPPCAAACPADFHIPGLMRRLEHGNRVGAAANLNLVPKACSSCIEVAKASNKPCPCEAACIRRKEAAGPVRISWILHSLEQLHGGGAQVQADTIMTAR